MLGNAICTKITLYNLYSIFICLVDETKVYLVPYKPVIFSIGCSPIIQLKVIDIYYPNPAFFEDFAIEIWSSTVVSSLLDSEFYFRFSKRGRNNRGKVRNEENWNI